MLFSLFHSCGNGQRFTARIATEIVRSNAGSVQSRYAPELCGQVSFIFESSVWPLQFCEAACLSDSQVAHLENGSDTYLIGWIKSASMGTAVWQSDHLWAWPSLSFFPGGWTGCQVVGKTPPPTPQPGLGDSMRFHSSTSKEGGLGPYCFSFRLLPNGDIGTSVLGLPVKFYFSLSYGKIITRMNLDIKS